MPRTSRSVFILDPRLLHAYRARSFSCFSLDFVLSFRPRL